MASTDTRPGFRLPWSSEARSPQEHPPGEASAEPEPEPAREPVDAAGSQAGDTASSFTGGQPAHETPTDASVSVDAHTAPASRRPTKFLADLAKAMRAAAEAERQDILDRFSADAKQFIEGIHEHSASEAAELKAAADRDIAGVRDWSKAEIARVREETERQITERRTRLEGEVDAHAARIEREVERVQRTVGTFGSDMAAFFEKLLAEEDPGTFAQLASSLPEPPNLEDVVWEADFVDTTWAESAAQAPAWDASPPAEVPAGQATDESAGLEASYEGTTTEPEAPIETEALQPGSSIDAEAVAPEATAVETVEPTDETVQPEAEAAVETPTTGAEAAVETPTAEAEAPVYEGEADLASAEPEAEAAEPATEAPTEPSFDDDSLALDPRVAALGLTPDFGAAEAEAAVAADEDVPDDGAEAIPTLDDETIAARLAGLVPVAGPASDSVETRVVVSGLVSVASIAGFKRSLARIGGVRSVSVSSGPDGEFVFAVNHGGDVDLGEHIATLSGFAARVSGTSEGTIAVVAHDPDATE